MASIPLATLHPCVYEFDAVIVHINDDGSLEFDKTYFYPTGGGQPNDLGFVKRNDDQFNIVDVRKKDGHIIHVVDRPGLSENDKLHCVIDEYRRKKLSRMHTAVHVLCGIIERAENTKITGNQIGVEYSRVDLDLPTIDQDKIKRYVDEANVVLATGITVKKYVTTREELMKMPELVKLAMGFPEGITDVHMVEIPGCDHAPCGGTHVDALSEIGQIRFDRTESKGKDRKRIYFTLV